MSGLRSIAVFGLAAAALVGRAFLLRGADGGIDLLDELDLGLLEIRVQLLDVGLVEIDLRDRGRDLREGEDAELLPLQEQALDFFQFLQVDY